MTQTAEPSLADVLFDGEAMGATLGGFALAWIAALALTRAAIAAAGFAFVLVDDPSLLARTQFWSATALAALLSRHRFDDAFAFTRRCAVHAVVGIAQPFGDPARLSRVLARRHGETCCVRAVATVPAPTSFSRCSRAPIR